MDKKRYFQTHGGVKMEVDTSSGLRTAFLYRGWRITVKGGAGGGSTIRYHIEKPGKRGTVVDRWVDAVAYIKQHPDI